MYVYNFTIESRFLNLLAYKEPDFGGSTKLESIKFFTFSCEATSFGVWIGEVVNNIFCIELKEEGGWIRVVVEVVTTGEMSIGEAGVGGGAGADTDADAFEFEVAL